MESSVCKWREGEKPKIVPKAPPPRFFCCACFICFLIFSGSAKTIFDSSEPSSTITDIRRIQEGAVRRAMSTRRKQLVGGGPGSYPPRCTSKCGDCTPCKAVHVPVPPGRAVIAEYYPEAWRCKCGNRLYLP